MLLAVPAWKVIIGKNNTSKIVLFSILYFLITLSPTSSFFPMVTPVEEKRLYMPQIGIFILLVYLIYKILGTSFFKKKIQCF